MLVYQNVKMRKSSLPQVCYKIHTLLAETKMDASLRFAGCTDSFNHPQDPFIGLCWWLRWRRLCQYNVGSYPTLSTKSTSAVLRPLHTGWIFWGELFAWKKIFFKLLIECLHTECEYHAAKKRRFHFSESSSNFSNFWHCKQTQHLPGNINNNDGCWAVSLSTKGYLTNQAQNISKTTYGKESLISWTTCCLLRRSLKLSHPHTQMHRGPAVFQIFYEVRLSVSVPKNFAVSCLEHY